MIPIKLLVIDDNSDCCSLVKFALELDKWQVFTANNGKEGTNLARSRSIDVILLDILMPELDGVDVYKLLKADLFTRNIPIIFITAMPQIVPKIKSQINENIEVITKPFDIDRLAEQITQICDRYDCDMQTHQIKAS